MALTLIAKCPSCGHKEKIGADQEDQPMCPKCYGPLIADRATLTNK